jgi:hypothetical protein
MSRQKIIAARQNAQKIFSIDLIVTKLSPHFLLSTHNLPFDVDVSKQAAMAKL